MSLAGMKVMRTVWTDTPRQYIILALTLLFFNFDYVHLSEGLPLNYFISAILYSKVSLVGGANVGFTRHRRFSGLKSIHL